MMAVAKDSSSLGKIREQRVKRAVRYYLSNARALQDKHEGSKETLRQQDITVLLLMLGIDQHMDFLFTHILFLERRIIKREQIPQKEKLFSIFEEYTE